ncbi:MAG TPA: ABC transporter substrate-binding protein [Acidimicrobiales bacterium]|nr:ABC transporter substrate-binding protein [Acidimicrobiales bacterium]
MRIRGVVACLCLALLASACNSTTRLTAAHQSAPRFDVAGGKPGIAEDEITEDTSLDGADASTSVTGGSTAPGSPTSSTPGPKAASATLAMGTGVTAKSILIGVETAKDINAATAAVGASTDNPEEGAVAQAVINYVNKHGGIAGRQVKAVFHEKDTTQGSWEVHAAATCAAFTEDNHVFAAIDSSVGGNDALASCLAQHGVPLVETDFWPFDAEAYKRLGHFLYQPSRMAPERAMAVYVDGLVSLGYFANGAKVGLIGFDAAPFQRMTAAVKARLASHHLALTDERTTITPHGVTDFGELGAQIQNAIISFRSRGVDHVIFSEYAGQLPFLFLKAADAQGFHPRYGFNSMSRANTQASQGPASMSGAVNVGWLPTDDADVTQEYRGGAFATCMDAAKQGGISGSASGQRLYTSIFCDALLFLKAGLEQATALTPAGFEDAVGRLGRSFDSPGTYATNFFPGRHDGAAAVRYTKYNAGCECMVYANDKLDPVG